MMKYELFFMLNCRTGEVPQKIKMGEKKKDCKKNMYTVNTKQCEPPYKNKAHKSKEIVTPLI